MNKTLDKGFLCTHQRTEAVAHHKNIYFHIHLFRQLFSFEIYKLTLFVAISIKTPLLTLITYTPIRFSYMMRSQQPPPPPPPILLQPFFIFFFIYISIIYLLCARTQWIFTFFHYFLYAHFYKLQKKKQTIFYFDLWHANVCSRAAGVLFRPIK